MTVSRELDPSALVGLLLCVTALLTAPSAAQAEGWATATPAEAGFAPDLGERVDAALEDEFYDNVHAVVLVRGGKLVLERYLEGDDELYGRRKEGVVFTPESLHDVRSITKSVVGLLYGAALAEGAVPPPDASLVEAFPRYADLAEDEQRRAIKVEHALSMTMGTEWNEDLPYSDPANSEIAMTHAPDSLRYALDRPLVSVPGERWTYNGGATALLAGLIAQGTGKDLAAYAREKLFEPLGIEKVRWFSDYYDVPYAASGLRLRPRDTAKIGQLVLQDGEWDGEQVVPAEWIAVSTEPKAEAMDGCGYGYQWWLCKTEAGLNVIEGVGWGGQELMILRDLDLVLMVNAGLYGDRDAWKRAYGLLEQVVIPAMVSR